MTSNPAPEKRGKGQSRQIIPRSISPSKNGRAIRGIGGIFAVNPVSSTWSIRMPIATDPVRSGFGPQLSLSYDAGSGGGPFGFCWSLSLPSLGRQTMDFLDTGTSMSPKSSGSSAPKTGSHPSRTTTIAMKSRPLLPLAH
jgi:hypothetical protein